MGWNRALAEHRAETLGGILRCRRHQAFGIGLFHGNGLFHNDVLPAFQSTESKGNMRIMRCCDNHRIGIGFAEEGFGVGEFRKGFFVAVTFQDILPDIADRCQSTVPQLGDELYMLTAHVPDADDADLYFFHALFFPWI